MYLDFLGLHAPNILPFPKIHESFIFLHARLLLLSHLFLLSVGAAESTIEGVDDGNLVGAKDAKEGAVEGVTGDDVDSLVEGIDVGVIVEGTSEGDTKGSLEGNREEFAPFVEKNRLEELQHEWSTQKN